MQDKRLAIFFSGDFPDGNMHNARLKGIGSELGKHQWRSDYISIFPSRYSSTKSEPQISSWEGLLVKYLSIGTTYFSNKFLRVLQIISGHIHLLFFLLRNHKKYDAYYFYMPLITDTLWAVFLMSIFGKTIIVDQTELFSSRASKFKWIHKFEEEVCAKAADGLVVISKNLQEHYLNCYNTKSYVLPIFVDLKRFTTPCNAEPGVIGYVGSFRPKDGLEYVLNEFSKAVKSLGDLKLRLFGYAYNLDELKSKISNLGLNEKVQLTGKLDYDDIPSALKSCDSLIMNRTHEEFSTFGYPWKLGEYLASNRLILMSDSGGFSEDFIDKKHLLKYKGQKDSSLSEVINYRYSKGFDESTVLNNAYEFVLKNFDQTQNVSNFKDFINQLISKS